MDEYSKGCLLGLACGDSAGTVLELPRVSPDQAADLAVCAWRSCTDGKYNQDKAAEEYSHATKSAAEMMAESAKFNRNSQANGALMRIAPLAVFGARNNIPVAQIAFDARQDAILSHPHPVCQESNVAFVVAIMHLLTVRGDVAGAHKAAVQAISNPDVLKWINDAMAGIDPGPVVQNAGHVKHALSLAFYHLGKRSRYRDAILDVRCRATDCGTNAAIVGAMIGALWGVKDIPACVRSAFGP